MKLFSKIKNFFFGPSKKSSRTENEELKARLSEANDSIDTLEKIKWQYENVIREANTKIQEANTKCEMLQKHLDKALEGKIDGALKEQLDDLEALRKKIKDLEGDLEDAEDDLSDAKKKLKNKEAYIATLQSELDKAQKESKRLQDELRVVQQTLDEKIAELQLKMGSLNFIQEILSASELKTAESSNLEKNIYHFESFVKDQFLPLTAELVKYRSENYNDGLIHWEGDEGEKSYNSIKQMFERNCDQWAATKKKSWLDGKTTVAFVGEFSAGKTSIVNRLLSQDNPKIPQLPVSTKATTAIPTYIAGGSAVSYSFISGDGKRKTISEDTFKKVSKEILDQVKGISSLIKYFVMTYKNPNLEGLSILDTPGFNSNDTEDKQRTIDVINECDALFWVFDVNAGTVNRSSISIIKERLNKPLYVVINKIDTKPTSEVQRVENLIKKTLADEGLTVQQFIRFSSKAPLNAIMEPIKSVEKIKGRETFVEDIGQNIDAITGIINNHVNNLQHSYTNSYNDGEQLNNEFYDCLNATSFDCNAAMGIPQWTTHVFSKDRYEMSQIDGNRLIGLLNQIANERMIALGEKFKERTDKAYETQQIWSDYCAVKEFWKKIQECKKQFNKITKNFN